MLTEQIDQEIELFCQEKHGNQSVDTIFVSNQKNKFIPLHSLIKKKILCSVKDLLAAGYTRISLDLYDFPSFREWYEEQFAIQLNPSVRKKIFIFYHANEQLILSSIKKMDQLYSNFFDQKILLNNKNFPTQLGEWYAKLIFGIFAQKSINSRGFEFFIAENVPVEIKVTWPDKLSPKGIKIKKSLFETNSFIIIVLLTNKFLIKDIAFIDTKQFLHNNLYKGITYFLKEEDIQKYLFSRSGHYIDRIINSNALLKFSLPSFALTMSSILENGRE